MRKTPIATGVRMAERLLVKSRPITVSYAGEEFMGMSVHFFVDELANEMRVRRCDDTFGSQAAAVGLSKTEFQSLILMHAPQS